ncbi:uncharacterized protein LOC116210202 isoform X2 [Punica granatum]|uniref:Uncharacterized protein LOC116210202 isoform X2 n=1 Tax=Punica granatum TaxID=22663 RepID=A0A6P8E018_PUNGR|nr:uncharacterized protein LOC116210202 isoform X2 [Punica granatum]
MQSSIKNSPLPNRPTKRPKEKPRTTKANKGKKHAWIIFCCAIQPTSKKSYHSPAPRFSSEEKQKHVEPSIFDFPSPSKLGSTGGELNECSKPRDNMDSSREDPSRKGKILAVSENHRTRKVPLNLLAILQRSDDCGRLEASTKEKLLDHLSTKGVLLDKSTKKYMYNFELNKNILTVLARGLSIMGGNDPRHWSWHYRNVEVAKLESVCWLDISGKFSTVDLSPNTMYGVVLNVRMEENCDIVPLNFKIMLPDGSKRANSIDLRLYEEEQWLEISLCEFKMSPQNVGEVAFSIYEHSEHWKGGILIGGVSFKPQPEYSCPQQAPGKEMEDQEMESRNRLEKPKTQKRPPPNCLAILSRAYPLVEPSSIVEQLSSTGVLLDRKTKKYMVDVGSNKNMFMMLARGLEITSGSDPKHWSWKPDKLNRAVEIIKLKDICWLDVSGKFQTVDLSPETEYEIVLRIKIGTKIRGFYLPVNYIIRLPNGIRREDTIDFRTYMKGSWHNIMLHKFKMTPENVGQLQFRLYEHSEHWKSGLVLAGISFKPATS